MRANGRKRVEPRPNDDARLVQYAASRDRGLRDEILAVYAPLVDAILPDFSRAGVPLEDLRQVGFLGLLSAVELFDPARGIKFKTYAGYLIRGEMLHFIRDHGSTIRQPRWLRRLNRRIEEAVGQFVGQRRRYPTMAELARRLNIREAGLLELLKTREAVRTLSLDAESEDEPPDFNPRRVRHEVYVSFQLPIEDKIVLYQAVERLNLLQRRVLFYLFFRGLSQPEAARRIGISQRQVSRLLGRSLDRLRALLAGS